MHEATWATALWRNKFLANQQKWLHWKEEGKTRQAVSSTVRSVCRAPEQVAKAPKAASAIIIKATGTKAERRAPPACSGRVTRVIK